MRIVPKKNQIVGRVVDIARSTGGLELPALSNKVTALVLIDAIGPDVKAYQPGELVLPKTFNWINLRGGEDPRVILSDDEVLAAIEGVEPTRLNVRGQAA